MKIHALQNLFEQILIVFPLTWKEMSWVVDILNNSCLNRTSIVFILQVHEQMCEFYTYFISLRKYVWISTIYYEDSNISLNCEVFTWPDQYSRKKIMWRHLSNWNLSLPLEVGARKNVDNHQPLQIFGNLPASTFMYGRRSSTEHSTALDWLKRCDSMATKVMRPQHFGFHFEWLQINVVVSVRRKYHFYAEERIKKQQKVLFLK